MTHFLRDKGLFPQEVFCVGRATKTKQIEYVLERLNTISIVFYDDSGKHIGNAKRMQRGSEISTHHVRSGPKIDSSELHNLLWSTVKSALIGMKKEKIWKIVSEITNQTDE